MNIFQDWIKLLYKFQVLINNFKSWTLFISLKKNMNWIELELELDNSRICIQMN